MANRSEFSDQEKGFAYQERGLFGRLKGRPLSKERQDALDTLLPSLDLSSFIQNDRKIDLKDVFGAHPAPLWMEIGFGNGEHVAALMRRHPDHFFIAAEPFVNGMSAFLKNIRDKPHDKIRVLMDDAMKAAQALPDACLDGIYILNPDPWPKTKHHKRRIVSTENLDVFARILKPGGTLIMTTDVPDLADWMVTHANNHPAFTWTAQCAADWQDAPNDWIPTRYETKGAKGAQKMVYLIFEKNR